ncbi:hypothetical protein [Elizabethkingia anophelis]|uniref:hypothetical protein n=1 Tax=Elizabethkingia anophelis TaxID=1117645 RepID=UPI00298492C5|nr:hypothetical protein [Elizabethkingia anophelis]HAY3533748.1 hypothetical protein [Elizabethkingia anophelis]HAY3545864.1 hypothetical protein [Elizabethkingia anophelis]HAY3590690.1 hypothetical protein [Elizabethkingia anophelis]
MSFPKHNVIPDKDIERTIVNSHHKACNQYKLEFHPFSICEFFVDMDVLQLQSDKTKEYVFGSYFKGRLVGITYFGSLYSEKDLALIQEKYMPKTWDEIEDYVDNSDGIWYWKYHRSQYAWIYNRILTKVK